MHVQKEGTGVAVMNCLLTPMQAKRGGGGERHTQRHTDTDTHMHTHTHTHRHTHAHTHTYVHADTHRDRPCCTAYPERQAVQ